MALLVVHMVILIGLYELSRDYQAWLIIMTIHLGLFYRFFGRITHFFYLLTNDGDVLFKIKNRNGWRNVSLVDSTRVTSLFMQVCFKDAQGKKGQLLIEKAAVPFAIWRQLNVNLKLSRSLPGEKSRVSLSSDTD